MYGEILRKYKDFVKFIYVTHIRVNEILTNFVIRYTLVPSIMRELCVETV